MRLSGLDHPRDPGVGVGVCVGFQTEIYFQYIAHVTQVGFELPKQLRVVLNF